MSEYSFIIIVRHSDFRANDNESENKYTYVQRKSSFYNIQEY